MDRFPTTDWAAGLLRLTLFVPSRQVDPAEWWEVFTGDTADQSTVNAKKGTSETVGPFAGGRLLLRTEPERLDWFLLPEEPAADELSPDLAMGLGSWDSLVEEFRNKAKAWMTASALTTVDRLAFGSILHHKEANREAGYERLAAYIPVAPSPDATDFLYQINYPVASSAGVDGLRLNRLTKWSVASFRTVNFNLAPGRTIATRDRGTAYAVRLELDFNTAPDFVGLFPADKLGTIFDELVTAAQAVAADGIGRS